jgi:hypothetical protein
MKLYFVSVNGPREPYLLDEPRIIEHVLLRFEEIGIAITHPFDISLSLPANKKDIN